MGYVLYAAAALYAALHLIAAAPRVRSGGAGPRLMALGGGMALTGAALGSFGVFPAAPLLFAIGGGLVCAAAVQNGRVGGRVHIAYHLVRFAVTALLAVGCFRLPPGGI